MDIQIGAVAVGRLRSGCLAVVVQGPKLILGWLAAFAMDWHRRAQHTRRLSIFSFLLTPIS